VSQQDEKLGREEGYIDPPLLAARARTREVLPTECNPRVGVVGVQADPLRLITPHKPLGTSFGGRRIGPMPTS
jgi:hypothetical protein